MNQTKNLQIQIEESLKNEIKANAAKRGMTLSALIKEILRDYLTHVK